MFFLLVLLVTDGQGLTSSGGAECFTIIQLGLLFLCDSRSKLNTFSVICRRIGLLSICVCLSPWLEWLDTLELPLSHKKKLLWQCNYNGAIIETAIWTICFCLSICLGVITCALAQIIMAAVAFAFFTLFNCVQWDKAGKPHSNPNKMYCSIHCTAY